jgi:hypothetical protein
MEDVSKKKQKRKPIQRKVTMQKETKETTILKFTGKELIQMIDPDSKAKALYMSAGGQIILMDETETLTIQL